MRTKLEKRLASALAPAALLAVVAGAALAQVGAPFQPIPMDRMTDHTLNDGTKTLAITGSAEGLSGNGHPFPQSFPYGIDSTNPSNMLPTIFGPALDSAGNPIPNTLPSSEADPYELHDDPIVTPLANDMSAEEDMALVIKKLKEALDPRLRRATDATLFRGGIGVPADPRRGDREVARNDPGAGQIGEPAARRIDPAVVQFGLDILEGNPVDRAYSGMPLLNYKGPDQLKTVDPVTKTVTVHQVWSRAAIQSDTFFIDPTNVLDEEWTIHYVIDVVRGGHEDFAPFIMYFDDPNLRNGMAVPATAFDGTFFPMEEGLRYEFNIKMAPGRYWNLTYHWGWRIHPPRIQAIENARKVAAGKTLVEWEQSVFGTNPSGSEEAKLAAIDMIGDLAPAKRMWHALREIKRLEALPGRRIGQIRRYVEELEAAFDDFRNRNRLPSGIKADPDADLTMVYLNNTLYGQIKGHDSDAQVETDAFLTRGDVLNVKLLNGDYFLHAYTNIDFGGLRGWENTFHWTMPLNHQGPWFTFGRTWWMPNLVTPAMVPPAERPDGTETMTLAMSDMAYNLEESKGKHKGRYLHDANLFMGKGYNLRHRNKDKLGEHDVEVQYRFDPSKRLKFYQFDPFHHGVAIWSVH